MIYRLSSLVNIDYFFLITSGLLCKIRFSCILILFNALLRGCVFVSFVKIFLVPLILYTII